MNPCMKNASVTDEVKAEGMLGTNYSTEEFGVMWARILIKWIKCGNALKSIRLEPDLKPVLITRKVTVEGNRIPGWGFGTVLNLNLGYIPFSDLFAHIVTQMCHLKNTHCHCWNLLFSSSWGHLWDFAGTLTPQEGHNKCKTQTPLFHRPFRDVRRWISRFCPNVKWVFRDHPGDLKCRVHPEADFTDSHWIRELCKLLFPFPAACRNGDKNW